MPIKLADVLENVNSNFGIIETSKHNIVGLYNGFVGTSPSLEVSYNGTSDVKELFRNAGEAPVQFYKLPLAASSAVNQVDATTAVKLETLKGGLISVKDSKLSGGDAVGVYIAQTSPTAGNTADANRANANRWTELIQDFDMYDTITAEQLSDLQATTGEYFYFAGYDTEKERTRKFSWADITSALTQTIISDLVLSGTITQEQADEGFGGGALGDFNNDGEITTSDLLIFLGNFGATGIGYETDFTTLSSDTQTAATIVPVAQYDLTTSFALSELTTFNYPLSLTTAGTAYGWASVSNSVNAANFVKLNDMVLGDDLTDGDNAGTPALIVSHWASRRLRVEVKFDAAFNASDALYPLLYVKITGSASTPTEQECIYYMKMQNGDYSVPLFTNGAEELTNQFAIVDLSDEDLVAATGFENHSTDLANGFTLNYVVDSVTDEYIEDIECRVFFVSSTEHTSVDVQKVITRVMST